MALVFIIPDSKIAAKNTAYRKVKSTFNHPLYRDEKPGRERRRLRVRLKKDPRAKNQDPNF
jgi:hypothetical protein